MISAHYAGWLVSKPCIKTKKTKGNTEPRQCHRSVHLECTNAVEVCLDLEEVADRYPVKLYVESRSVQEWVHDTYIGVVYSVVLGQVTHQNEGGIFSVEGVALVDLGHGGVHPVGG